MRIIARISIWDKIAQFYIRAKFLKYKHSYGWDEVLRDIDLAANNTDFRPHGASKQDWINHGYRVVINGRGWAFAYLMDENGDMVIYDVDNYRNLNVRINPTAVGGILGFSGGNKSNNLYFSIGYGWWAIRGNDGYLYIRHKNGQTMPNIRFNEIIKPFRKRKDDSNIYAIGQYGGKNFKVYLNGKYMTLEARRIKKKVLRLNESQLKKLITESVLQVLYEGKKKLGDYIALDGQWWDGLPHGLEHKGNVQDVRMYDRLHNDDTIDTIGLFRRCDNRKFFYARIIPTKVSKGTKWKQIKRGDVPKIILDDFATINPQGHEPYLPL